MSHYSTWDNEVENCLRKYDKHPDLCIPPPSSFNLYNVTSLANFKIRMLEEIISNSFFGHKLGVCHDAVNILPPTIVHINTNIADPRQLNRSIPSLPNLASRTFPFEPFGLNGSSPAQIATWWWNSVEIIRQQFPILSPVSNTTVPGNFVFQSRFMGIQIYRASV
jgi:hypothetical protein